jgi:hypothetical protein
MVLGCAFGLHELTTEVLKMARDVEMRMFDAKNRNVQNVEGFMGSQIVSCNIHRRKFYTTDTVSGDVCFDFLGLPHFLVFYTVTHLNVSLEVFIFFAYLYFNICSTHISLSILLT